MLKSLESALNHATADPMQHRDKPGFRTTRTAGRTQVADTPQSFPGASPNFDQVA